MNLSDKVREKMRSFLRIDTPNSVSVNIRQLEDYDAYVFKNKIWCRGKADELEQLYSFSNDNLGNRHFWGSKPSQGMNIRKIHTGLPKLIIKVLTDVCTEDLYSIDVGERQKEWDEIAKVNKLNKTIKKAVKNVLEYGDGAFKFSYDKNISEYPIIEFFPAERVEYEYTRGIVSAVIFKTEKRYNNKPYVLKERYAYKSITYKLETPDGKEADMSAFDDLRGCVPVSFEESFLPAVRFAITESDVYKGRGEAVFDSKYDDFDALDECVSQWLLALRKGQIKEFIPVDFLPTDSKGELKERNYFDTNFIVLESDMSENGTNKIETTQGLIQHEALLSTYITVLDICLQGIISPSTLGIDVKKLDNAEAQREKEKTTLYTRSRVVDELSDVIKELVDIAFKFYDTLNKVPVKDITANVNFGGYANPSFEANIETISKAAVSGIMSVDAQVEELYGDDKDEEWKKEEIKRIKAEKGITEVDEPAINSDAGVIN